MVELPRPAGFGVVFDIGTGFIPGSGIGLVGTGLATGTVIVLTVGKGMRLTPGTGLSTGMGVGVAIGAGLCPDVTP
jgi:hypothetical protein